MRQKLIELIETAEMKYYNDKPYSEHMADFLIKNGVIIEEGDNEENTH